MKFIVQSVTFKIILVALVMTSIYEIGVYNEGVRRLVPPIFLMWYLHLNSFLWVTWGDALANAIYSITNALYFFGTLLSLYLLHKQIDEGAFRKSSLKWKLVLIAQTLFAILVISHYVDMFLNQERTFFERAYVFNTPASMVAFNAWDGILSVAILLQIIQATIKTWFSKGQKNKPRVEQS